MTDDELNKIREHNRQSGRIITKALLGVLGLGKGYGHLANEKSQNISSEITSSESLKKIEDLANKVLLKRKSLKENINSIEVNISSLETEFFKKQSGVFNKLFTKKETIENIGNEIDKNRELLNNLKTELEDCKLNVDELADPSYQDKYAEVVSTFKELSLSKKIWDVVARRDNVEVKSSASSTVDRTEVSFSPEILEFIECKYSALHFQNANGANIYLYPTFILLKDKYDLIKLIDLKELKFSFRQQRFLESKLSLPVDAEVIDYTWAKVNKDGSPDKRFVGNYQIPVAKYAAISLSSKNGLDELYFVSNYKKSENFSNKFDSFLSFIHGNPVSDTSHQIISETEFRVIKEFGDKFVEFITTLQNDAGLCSVVMNNESLQKLNFGNADNAIKHLFIIDVAKCFNQFASLKDTSTKEFFALLYLYTKILRPSFEITYSLVPQLYKNVVPTLIPLFESMKGETDQRDIEAFSFFKISTLLGSYDNDLKTNYHKNLYQFASMVVKADGVVTKNEEETLKRIMVLDKNSMEQTSQKKPVRKSSPKLTNNSIEEVLEELNDLTGLDGVKKEITTLINFIKIQKAREEAGLRSSSISYHIVFTGNPGTGKTTVARIVAKIYKCLGILNEGQLVETDRSGLIAEYVGQTAIKVNKAIDSALNGVLFIDEAYSIAGKGDNDYGKEAVATLIKRMEDDRDKLIVIIAGYIKEMSDFIETNPGFKSRFNRYIDFADYTPPELLSIYETQCSKLEYNLTNEAKAKLVKLFDTAFRVRDHTFGNGRFVRNVFEKTLEKQANRIASIASLDKETLTTITENDVP